MLDSSGNPTLPATALPDFIELDTVNTSFNWLSLHTTDEGTYKIRLTGYIDGTATYLDFTIIVQVCGANIVTLGTQTTANPTAYNLGQGALNLDFVFL